MIDDCIVHGKDVTHGGARYNSSGAACIGLADVIDSLMAIKQLVFDRSGSASPELKRAVDTNFDNDPALLALVTNKVPLFGSGSDEAVAMANRITEIRPRLLRQPHQLPRRQVHGRVSGPCPTT